MAMNSVSEISIFLNNQIKTQEQIEACLWQLDALMTMASVRGAVSDDSSYRDQYSCRFSRIKTFKSLAS